MPQTLAGHAESQSNANTTAKAITTERLRCNICTLNLIESGFFTSTERINQMNAETTSNADTSR